jgi:uncharacterized MAPEG superfamily protein
MKNTEIALMGYAAWTLFLLCLIVSRRGILISLKNKAPNAFNPTGEDVGGFDQRLVRAHANCYENLPIFATIAMFAIYRQYFEITDKFALVLLGARIVQSIVHMASTSVMAVYTRFFFFGIQIIIMIEWLWCIFTVK